MSILEADSVLPVTSGQQNTDRKPAKITSGDCHTY